MAGMTRKELNCLGGELSYDEMLTMLNTIPAQTLGEEIFSFFQLMNGVDEASAVLRHFLQFHIVKSHIKRA